MSEQMKELMSAFMDGELDEHHTVLEQLKTDDELHAAWSRYHVIRDSLKQRYLPAASVIASRVATALEKEPVIIAPYHKKHNRKQPSRAIGWAAAASVLLITALWLTQTVSFTGDNNNGFELTSSGQTLQASAEVEQTLSDYIVNHNEYSASSKMQGMLPYTRLVSYVPAQQSGTERVD
jgi:sigma-E factor negative regulatory protein RseA